MARPPDIQPHWALFLDLDGTLIDIAPRPDLVDVPEGLPGLLKSLSGALDGAVAIVTGRELQVIDALLTPFHASAGTEHGAVVRRPDGHLDESVVPPVPEAWLEILDQASARVPGLVVERKARSVVVHYRQAPEQRDKARALVDSLPGVAGSGFAVLAGHMTFEVKPQSVTKGRAVALLMETAPFAGRFPVFVGDDITDEDGMAAARNLGGLGLRVDAWFPNGPADVRDWLARGARC